jgi:hypothetical protein
MGDMTTWILILMVAGGADAQTAKLPGYTSERECMQAGAQAGVQQRALLDSLFASLRKPYLEYRIFDYHCISDGKE